MHPLDIVDIRLVFLKSTVSIAKFLTEEILKKFPKQNDANLDRSGVLQYRNELMNYK